MAAPDPLFDDWLRRANIGAKASYRPAEVALLLDCSPRTVRRMTHAGMLDGITLRKHLRITYDSLLEHFNSYIL